MNVQISGAGVPPFFAKASKGCFAPRADEGPAKRVSAKQDGGGGRDRTRADAVLETAALPLSYTPVRSTDDGWADNRNRNWKVSVLCRSSSVTRYPSWSLGTESNRRPPDSHSGVLTTELPQGLTLTRNWCRWVDLNNRPSPYESAALPLSYTGVPPHGFEPRLPHPKCGVLPLDEGGANPSTRRQRVHARLRPL